MLVLPSLLLLFIAAKISLARKIESFFAITIFLRNENLLNLAEIGTTQINPKIE